MIIRVSSQDSIYMDSRGDFRIHSGGKLSLSASDAIEMTCRENAIRLETSQRGIELQAKKPIQVMGGEKIEVTSKGKLTATTKETLQVTAEKRIEATAKEAMKLGCKTNQIQLETEENGILITSGRPIKVAGKEGVAVTSRKDFTVTSVKKIRLSGRQKVTLHSDQGLESTCRGSSICLDGEIDLKAKMIREN